MVKKNLKKEFEDVAKAYSAQKKGVIVAAQPELFKRARENKAFRDDRGVWTKIAIYTPFALSVGFLLRGAVNASYTGAIIGGGEVDFNILVGIGFLFFGLAVHHFSQK